MNNCEIKSPPVFSQEIPKWDRNTYADGNAMGAVIEQLFNNTVYNKEELKAKTDAEGGDISETQVSVIDESTEAFPVPMPEDKTKGLWGKLKKWQQDCLAKFGNYVLTSMITNQHVNSTENIPSSALVYLMQQGITQLNRDIGVLSNNLGSVILGESLSGVSFVSSVGEKIGEIHLSAGVYLVFSVITLNKDRVSPGTIADIVINASHGASASLCRDSEENISTVKWDTKTLVGLHTGNSATVVGIHTTIYGGDLQVDAIQCKGIYAVRLR